MMLLRFLYSVEKNRKAFKLVFPPEIFGAFIDIGNYERDLHKYISVLKKINKLALPAIKNILGSFEDMKAYAGGFHAGENQKVI